MIIAGIGRFGQIVNRLVQNSGYKTVVLDHDMQTIQVMRRFGFNPFTRADGDHVHEALCELIQAGRIRPHVGRVVSMADAGGALADHAARRTVGRTVVQIR